MPAFRGRGRPRYTLVHSVHAAAVTAACWSTLLLFWDLRYQRFGRQHQRCDRTRVGQCRAHHLRRIEHARLDQVFVLAGQCVVPEVVVLRVVDLADHDGTFFAGILGDLAQRLGDGALHDVYTDLLVTFQLQSVESRNATCQSNAAAGANPFLDCCTPRVHCVFDTGLLLFHFGFGRGTNFDHRHATDQLRQPLLQFLAVVVAGGLVDLAANFFHAALHITRLAFAFDDGGVVFVDGDLLGLSEIGQLHVLQLDPQIFRDRLAAGQCRDVLQHCLAAIAEAWSLDGRDLQRATKFVDDESRKRLAFHILCDDQERLAALGDLLQQWQQVFHRADFLFVDQDVRVFLHRLHALRIGDEVRRQIAAIELHAFDYVELRFQRLRLFDGDDAILADFLHRFGNDLPDGLVVVRRDRAHLGNHLAGDGLGELVEFTFDASAFLVEAAANGYDGLLDTALHRHRIGASSDSLHALAINCLGKNGSCGGAIAGNVRGLRSNFADHLGAHVLDAVGQFNFFRYGDAVLGDGRRTEFLFDDNVAALGAKCDLYRVSQQVDAAENGLSRLFSMNNLLCHICLLLKMYAGPGPAGNSLW